MAARGIEVVVHTPADHDARAPLGGASVELQATSAIEAWTGGHIARRVEQGGYDLVHLHDPYLPLAPAALRLARGMPLVMTLHNLRTDFRHGTFLQRAYRASVIAHMERRTLAAARRVIVCSPSIRDRIATRLHAKTAVIPNGVHASRFDVETKKLPGDPAILHLGMLDERKGVDLLLSAWPQVRAQLPGARLTIAGTGPAAAALSRMAQPFGTDVSFVGYVPESEKASLLKGADIAVAYSRVEPFGIIALEAMAAGVPLIAARVGGLPSVVGEEGAGLLVGPEDPDQLAGAIVRLATDADMRARMAVAGPRRARDFSWESVAARTAEIYEAALRGPR
ncbi:MAG: glycosyltransferase family 4 protein [Gemmatimonadota bacterium]